MIVTKGGDVKLKVMVATNLINYTLCYVRKLWIANILRNYFSIYPSINTWIFGKISFCHKVCKEYLKTLHYMS
jgi:hypothetical protein